MVELYSLHWTRGISSERRVSRESEMAEMAGKLKTSGKPGMSGKLKMSGKPGMSGKLKTSGKAGREKR